MLFLLFETPFRGAPQLFRASLHRNNGSLRPSKPVMRLFGTSVGLSDSGPALFTAVRTCAEPSAALAESSAMLSETPFCVHEDGGEGALLIYGSVVTG